MTQRPGDDGVLWAREIQCRIFYVTLGIFSLALAFIVGRSWLEGGLPWADTFALVVLYVILPVAPRRPERVRVLMWVILGAMLLDVIDGLLPWKANVVTPTHLLLPALVLYGTVLGDMVLSFVTVAVVFLIYGFTWYVHWPLTPEDASELGNLMLVTAGTGLLAYVVWKQGRALVKALHQRAADLMIQLEENQRLTAVLSHDIVNPLTALRGTLELAHQDGSLAKEELAVAQRMADRMMAIIDGVRDLNRDADVLLPLEPISVQELWNDLDEVFKPRLAAKEQRFALSSGADLRVNTNVKHLNASVLGNLLTNACKFSPTGSTIEMAAQRRDNRVRISLHNPGAGFTPDQLDRVSAGQSVEPHPGTEGEKGHGYGLRIARFYLQRLQGEMEVANGSAGVVVTVILPAAS